MHCGPKSWPQCFQTKVIDPLLGRPNAYSLGHEKKNPASESISESEFILLIFYYKRNI